MRGSLFGLLAVAGALLLQVAAPAAALTVLYDKSRITCVSRQENVPVEAQFRKFTAQIAFDPARPEAGMAQIDRKSTRLNSSHIQKSRMPSSA